MTTNPDDAMISGDHTSALTTIPSNETAAVAVAEQAKALVQAKFIMALKQPRDIDRVRVRILRDCKRPRFAEAALYSIPRAGTQIVGPTIRFAEAVVVHYGNIDVNSLTLYDDHEKRIIRVTAIDLETNASWSKDITIEKSIERRKLGKGQIPISQRVNSQGKVVYRVEATDDELMMKEASMFSKWARNLSLRLVPYDIKEEAVDVVRETMRNQDAQDPDATRKKLASAFAELGVEPSDLVELLGHELGRCSPLELEKLRGIHMAVKTGEVTWGEVLAEEQHANTHSEEMPRDLEGAAASLEKRGDK